MTIEQWTGGLPASDLEFVRQQHLDFYGISAAIMIGGAVVGGYVGGQLARKTPARIVRAVVVTIGLTLTALLAYRATSHA